MKLKVVKLNNNVKLPKYESKQAAGFDFVANNFKRLYQRCYNEVDDVEFEEVINIEKSQTVLQLYPGDRALIGTGLKMEIPAGYELQVRPRSGLALKEGVTVLNSPGTIDADYRGEVGVILINSSSIPMKIKLGDRIAQGVFHKYEQASWDLVDELSTTDRGEGGFGSTGKK